ncbi:T9SS type A sorting domain-containing protein [uncultured Flavobacterium sp.]|uniref:T9SS type A sorting domain-containing protein n=1 Tax=uncultured Flavobacterium sp. TaxID=165435 RepID=UPI0025E53826|nr:T9SS type A sorting domain-containing protein [uncultured Flavobacterium sp.]
MELKKLLKTKLFKASAFAGVALFALSSEAQVVNVTVGNLDTQDMWKGYANMFQNNGNFENNLPLTYIAGQEWGVAEIKSTLNATANTITLQPNYNAYDATNPDWSDGNGNGNRIFEGNTYVERTDLAGQQLVFSGKTTSTNLVPAFQDIAFIKVLNPANNYATELSLAEPLAAGENFTLSTGSFVIQPGRIVQYGFSVLGKNANPTQETTNGSTVVTADAPEVNEGNIVTIDASDYGSLMGYATWYQLDGETWINGGEYGVSDLKTTADNTNNRIILQPNFLAYATGGPEWQNGETGSRIFEANSYITDDALLNQTVTFKGHTFSNNLAAGYTAIAFVKVLSPDYTNILLEEISDLTGGEDWNINVTASGPVGAHVQYGFIVKGLNANPTQETALGSAIVGLPTASVADFSKTAIVMFPNPASSVLNFSSENTIESIEIYNIMGQKVVNAKPSNNAATVDVSGLSNGVYIVNSTVNGKQNSARFIKQ